MSEPLKPVDIDAMVSLLGFAPDDPIEQVRADPAAVLRIVDRPKPPATGVDIDAARKLLDAIPALPLYAEATKRSELNRRRVWMDDHGDGRFVAEFNDLRGDYSTLFVNAPSLLRMMIAEVEALRARAEKAEETAAFLDRVVQAAHKALDTVGAPVGGEPASRIGRAFAGVTRG